MDNLELAYPKQIDRAVPRNQQCGYDPILLAPSPAQTRAPVEVSPSGIPEIGPEWVRANLSAVTVVDVREPDELHGELEKIDEADAIPLREIPGHLADVARDRPLVLVCRSGGRSGKAALSLVALGFTRVASMRGGMTAWQASAPAASRPH